MWKQKHSSNVGTYTITITKLWNGAEEISFAISNKAFTKYDFIQKNITQTCISTFYSNNIKAVQYVYTTSKTQAVNNNDCFEQLLFLCTYIVFRSVPLYCLDHKVRVLVVNIVVWTQLYDQLIKWGWCTIYARWLIFSKWVLVTKYKHLHKMSDKIVVG